MMADHESSTRGDQNNGNKPACVGSNSTGDMGVENWNYLNSQSVIIRLINSSMCPLLDVEH